MSGMPDDICQCPRCGRMHKDLRAGTPPAMLITEVLVTALHDLLDRVKRNGGIGEYRGGPVFVIKRAEEALAAARKYLPNNGG